MIEINLLPAVKREYLKAQQMKHTVVVGSVLVSLGAIGLLALMFIYVQVIQPQQQKSIQSDIDKSLNDSKNKKNAVKVVTVQGALQQIPSLQDKKMITSNLFIYLNSFTPKDVSYSNIKMNLTESTIVLQGNATNFEQANVLANNIKSAKFTFKKSNNSQSVSPFTNVVFDGLTKSDKPEENKNVSFQITLKVDPVIFDQSVKDGKISVNASSEELLLPTDKPFVGGAQ